MVKNDKKVQKPICDYAYSLAFDYSNEPMSFVDDSTDEFLDVNNAFCDLLGYQKEQVIGKTSTELDLFINYEEARTAYNQLKRDGFVHNYPIEIKKADGSTKYSEISSNIINCNDRMIRFSVMRDQTEYVKYQNELSTNKDRFRMMIENITDVIGITDRNGTVIYRSPNNESVFGVKPEETLSLNAFDFVHPDDRDRIKMEFNKVINNCHNASTTGEFRYRCKDGTYKNVELTGKNLLNNKAINGILLTYKDISEKKKSEKIIEEDTERYNALIESTNDMIWIVDPVNFGLVKFNSALANLFKCRGIIIEKGMTPKELLPEDYVDSWYSMYAKAITDGPYKIEYITVGGTKNLMLSFNPLKVNGELIGISIFGQDITNEVIYKEELKNSNHQLARKFQESINAISKIGELRDMYTAGHQKRVQELACAIANEMDLTEETIHNIYFGALIHDIGKIYVPSEILNKPGKITELEYKILQTHVEYGYEVVKEIDFQSTIPTMIYQHHERLDGSGYPKGLIGDQIILESRILAVADVVEAMSSHRPYRAALGIDVALDEITNYKGTCYDNEVVDICINLFRQKGFKFTI